MNEPLRADLIAGDRFRSLRRSSVFADVLLIAATALFLATVSTLIGIGAFVISQPAERPVFIQYIPADQSGRQ